MGRRGPAPEPLEAKLARGETRPSRLNVLAPKPSLRPPVMPRDMTVEAKVVWRRVMREQASGLIRAVDTDLLRAYCEAVARYEGAMRLYTAPLLTTRGSVVKNPLHQIVRDDTDTMRLLARELGIGPAARAGLQIEAFGHAGPDSIEAEIGPPPRQRFAVVGGTDLDD
jgi:P27 family predicted phage terminase small subunit